MEEIEASYYYALSHELRRKIITIIGENDFTSFTHLKKELKVSTGTIYHHLDTLSQLISQKKNKKYYLTELGQHAYNSLKENIETIESPDLSSQEFNSPLLKALMALTPKSYFAFEEDDKPYVIILSAIVLLLGAILCGLNGLFPLLLFFGQATEDLQALPIEIHVVLALSFVFNVFVYFLLTEVLSRLFFRKMENTLQLFYSFGIIFYPMVFYLIVHFLFVSFQILQFGAILVLDRILMIFFQVWSLWLMTYNLSMTKGVKIENGLTITLLLHYGAFTVLLFMAF